MSRTHSQLHLYKHNFELQLFLVLICNCYEEILSFLCKLHHATIPYTFPFTIRAQAYPFSSHPCTPSLLDTDLMRVQQVVSGVLSTILGDLASQISFTTGGVHTSTTRISQSSLFSTGIYLMPGQVFFLFN